MGAPRDRRVPIDSLAQAAILGDFLREIAEPPVSTGAYKSRPEDALFFRTEYASARGRFFLHWYSDTLVHHCDDVLSIVRTSTSLNDESSLGVKVSGVHSHYLSTSRAAEATAGYLVSE